MGRTPCCDKANVKKGPWSPEEDSKLKEYIEKHGTGGNWIALPHKAGLKRCGKSCRLRWLNYLRPNIKHGEFSDEEDRIICALFANIGSRWSVIAAQLPGRTDNDIKNYWNTKLKKKFMSLLPASHHSKPLSCFPLQNPPFSSSQSLPSSMYTDCSSLSCPSLDPTYVPLNYNKSTAHFPCFQNQESILLSGSALQNDGLRDNLIMFGSEGSCSSSDGSCSQVSHSREIKQEDIMGIQNHTSRGYEEYGNKSMLSNGSNNNEQWVEKSNEYFGETPLDNYNIDDIEQLINCSSNSSNDGYNGYYFNIGE